MTSRKKQCTEVRNIEFLSKQPSKFFVFTFLSLQFKCSAHSCILCYLISFRSYPFAYFLTFNYLFQTLDKSNFFRFPSKVRVIKSRSTVYNISIVSFVRIVCFININLQETLDGFLHTDKLKEKIVKVLKRIHQEKAEGEVRVDMWCHFGRAYITKVDEGGDLIIVSQTY